MKKSYIVDSTCNDMRIDRWIRNNIGKFPQALIEKSLRSGKIKLNKKKIKSSHKIRVNDKIDFFDFNFNLYNKTLTIEFIKYIREEIEFKSVDELIKKLNNDREYCLKHINSIINN